jgi:biopolymer transport protein ExbD
MSAVGRKKSAVQDKIEPPNLVPIMNLVTILIPFLLLTVQFVHLAVIDSSLPAIGAPKATTDQIDPKPPLMLTVAVTDRGFIVGGNAAILSTGTDEEVGQITDVAQAVEREPTIKLTSDTAYCESLYCRGLDSNCTGADYTPCHNFSALTDLLVKVKAEYPDEQNVILIPESEVVYENIVYTMDATRDHMPEGAEKRELLFPFVVIAGGAQ